MQLKRISDNWIFAGDFIDYSPPKPRTKVSEIQVIRGASRYQVLGTAGSSMKFGMRMNDSEMIDFLSKIEYTYEFTDAIGKTYKGIVKDDPEVKKIAPNIYEITISLYSRATAGVGN